MKRSGRFKNEQDLYRAVCTGLDLRLRNDPTPAREGINDPLEYVITQVNGRAVYVLGEYHFSRKQVDKAHTVIVPKIEADPQSWLLLREDNNKYVRSPFEDPTLFYFQELTSLFRIPYQEAKADLQSQPTRDYIMKKTGLMEIDLDWFVHTLNTASKTARFLVERNDERYIQILLNEFRLRGFHGDSAYVRQIRAFSPMSQELVDTITKHWNDFSRQRFYGILDQYTDKMNILVSVGGAHIPAFQESN